MNKVRFLFFIICFCFYSFAQNNSWKNNKHYVVEDTSKYTYSMILDDLSYFYTNFPEWVHPIEVGKSEFGLELATVRIGYEKPKKNAVFLVGNIHAREDYSSKLVMKFLNIFLLNISNQDTIYPKAKSFLDSIDIYVMPVANPDGLKIAHLDFKGIEDSFNLYKDKILVLESFEEWKANGKGIDLNSSFDDGNHPVKKAKNAQSVLCSEGYKGEYPAQAKETQLLQNFIHKIKPLVTVSFHTKGNVVYWADEESHDHFCEIDTKINRIICNVSGFQFSNVSKAPSNYGCGYENYIRIRHGLLASCVELDEAKYGRKQSPDNEFNIRVWNKAWQIPYSYIESAIKYKNDLLKINDF